MGLLYLYLNLQDQKVQEAFLLDPLTLNDGGSTFLGNVRKTYTNDTVSHPRRPESSR
jgi:hypothetical protein